MTIDELVSPAIVLAILSMSPSYRPYSTKRGEQGPGIVISHVLVLFSQNIGFGKTKILPYYCFELPSITYLRAVFVRVCALFVL